MANESSPLSTPGSPEGPIDEHDWPSRLRAHVVEPGAAPRIHGYDAEADLAAHYRFPDTLALLATGELPEEATSRALEVALQFLAAVPVSEAPGHVAVLSRVCATTHAASLALGALALAEQAEQITREHQGWLAWLEKREGLPPASSLARDERDRESVARLRAALAPTGRPVAGLELDLGRMAAILAVLHACGIRTAASLQTLLVVARLGTVAAEALARPAARFGDYPMTLPPICYEGNR